MRRRITIVIVSMIAVLALVAEIGHVWLGWWQCSPATISETAGGYDSAGESATLEEVLASAHRALDGIERNVHDYSAVIVKKERNGKDLSESVMFAKIREKPLSVYLYFFMRRNDPGVKGREVLYVQGRNDGKLLVHTSGILAERLGTLRLDPRGWLAMNGERHPITEIGLANLCRQLIERGESLGDPSRVQVRHYRHARINQRACTLWEIAYLAPESKSDGCLVRVFVDKQWHFPICVEVYELPLDRTQEPRLMESYAYLDLKLNNGYSDADFSAKDPQYKFR